MAVFSSAIEEDVNHTVFPEPVARSPVLSRSLSLSKGGRRPVKGDRTVLPEPAKGVETRALRQAVSTGSTRAAQAVTTYRKAKPPLRQARLLQRRM